MRETKFRAFVLGKMYDVLGLDWTEEGLCITTDGGFITLPDENAHLLEFTGLSDSKGKEIYEGDIVRGELHGGYWESSIKFSPRGGFDIIPVTAVMDDGDKGHRVYGWSAHWKTMTETTTLEVIGNIYDER